MWVVAESGWTGSKLARSVGTGQCDLVALRRVRVRVGFRDLIDFLLVIRLLFSAPDMLSSCNR